MKRPSRLPTLLFIGLDALFGPLVTFAFVHLFVGAHALQAGVTLLALLLVKVGVCSLAVRASFRNYDLFHSAERTAEKDGLVVAADQGLQGFGRTMALVYPLTWLGMLAGGHMIFSLGSDYFATPEGSLLPAALVTAATMFGALALAFPLAVLLAAEPAGVCSVYARKRGISLPREPIGLQQRIGLMAFALALGPFLWMVGVGYWTQIGAVTDALGGRTGEVARELIAEASQGFLINAGIFAVLVCFWAPVCAVLFSRAVSQPLERLAATTKEVVEEGNQTRLEVLPSSFRDEAGILSERFNDLLDMMRDLSRAADDIASGRLYVKVSRAGELPDAFRRMTESLNDLVGQIRQTSVSLAAAATEILAATQEQESAATSQSSAMTEISHTMDSLSSSAAHVSHSVSEVLANAEQTLTTTDNMVAQIESLSNHTGRITELLNTIQSIADKSDLLALNGSLEASRAGEGGQGFALVAAEMRRLAERVTASVEDVKKLVTDIHLSSTSTIMATEEGRRFARETTDAARSITLVSQQQLSGTEQVSQSVRGLAEVVTQAAAATSQTRTTAQGLKRQADQLSELVKRFEIAKAEA